ncbi:MAG: molybdopterin-binding protein [Variibacter sp.]
MGPSVAPPQRIVRLTALPEVLTSIGRLAPVAPRSVSLAGARGRVLAEDICASGAVPAIATAARDGWAVAADQVTDASSYAPVPMTGAVWVDAGDPMPPATDAVLPPEAMSPAGGRQQALAAVPVGEDVLAPGSDAAPDTPLARRGTLLRAADVAALHACGVERVAIREPRVTAIAAPGTRAHRDAAVALIADAVAAAGGVATSVFCDNGADALARALRKLDADMIITIGGTGAGRQDGTVRTVAALGRVDHHGIGIAPGETTALGACEKTPVLMLPGRLDAALAGWLLIGDPLLRRLSGANEPEPAPRATLARKITSTIGLAEIVLVRRTSDGVTPAAARLFPLQATAQADGYVVVPPESEGFPAGTNVAVRPLP